MEPGGLRYTERCSLCGEPARVFMGSTSYCLNCYNRITDYLAGAESPTNDSYQILALDSEGHTVEFAVERFSLGTRSVWTAVEQVADDDPRVSWGYVGRSVSIAADAQRMTQEEALDALMVKVQRLVGHASLRSKPIERDQVWATSAQIAGRVLYAADTGVARVEPDDNGAMSVVVDGQRFTPEQFVDLLSCFEGFDVYWQVRDAADEAPPWL